MDEGLVAALVSLAGVVISVSVTVVGARRYKGMGGDVAETRLAKVRTELIEATDRLMERQRQEHQDELGELRESLTKDFESRLAAEASATHSCEERLLEVERRMAEVEEAKTAYQRQHMIDRDDVHDQRGENAKLQARIVELEDENERLRQEVAAAKRAGRG